MSIRFNRASCPTLVFLIFLASCSSRIAEPGTSADYCSALPEAVEHAVRLRNLAQKEDIACKRGEPSVFMKYFKQDDFSQDTNPERLASEEATLKQIGLIPPNFPYAQCLVETNIENATAFYSLSEKTIIVPSWKPTTIDTLVRESIHALQDQHFNLTSLRDQATHYTDKALAFSAIIEGEASFLQRRFRSEQLEILPKVQTKENSKQETNSCIPPSALDFQYDFPYSFGARFVERVINEHGIDGLNALYRKIPQTSSEILYQYGKSSRHADFEPELVDLRAPDGVWKGIYSDTLGEYTIRCLLRETIGSKRAVLAALGWRGDRLALYQKPDGSSRLIWNTRWKHDGDAEQFANSLRAHFAQLRQTSPEPWGSSQQEVIESSGRDVTLVILSGIEKIKDISYQDPMPTPQAS